MKSEKVQGAKAGKIASGKVDKTRATLEKQVEVARYSVENGKRLTDDQMYSLGRSMMEHLLAVGDVASW